MASKTSFTVPDYIVQSQIQYIQQRRLQNTYLLDLPYLLSYPRKGINLITLSQSLISQAVLGSIVITSTTFSIRTVNYMCMKTMCPDTKMS